MIEAVKPKIVETVEYKNQHFSQFFHYQDSEERKETWQSFYGRNSSEKEQCSELSVFFETYEF